MDYTALARNIFALAEHYREASIILKENQAMRDTTEIENYGCFGPHILVDSFSVELYLKCLYVLDVNKPPHGHDWEKLYNDLKEETKLVIRHEHDRIISLDPIVGRARILEMVNPDAVWVRDFEGALTIARLTFSDKRYLYETKEVKEEAARLKEEADRALGKTKQPKKKEEEAKGWKYAHFLGKAIRSVLASDPRVGDLAKDLTTPD